jgi:hypothetical protein
MKRVGFLILLGILVVICLAAAAVSGDSEQPNWSMRADARQGPLWWDHPGRSVNPRDRLVPLRTAPSGTRVPAASISVNVTSSVLAGAVEGANNIGDIWADLGAKWAAVAVSTVNVKDFSANGDGATDDTRAIQAAVDAASSAGGGIVRFPPGTYLTGQVSLKSNVWMVGVGWASVLKLKNNGNNYVLATVGTDYFDNITVANLQVDGNKANNSKGGGIYLHGRNMAVLNTYVHDTADACILLGVPGNGVSDTPDDSGHRILGNHCKNPATPTNNWGGIAVTHGSNFVIANNIVESTDGYMTYGIDIEPNRGNTLNSVMIANNRIKGGRLFVDCKNLLSPCTDVLLVGNLVDAAGSKKTGFDNQAPLYLRKVDRFKATGNTFIGDTNTPRQGIFIAAPLTSFDISENTIYGRTYAGGTAYGIYFNDEPSVASSGVLADNAIIGLDAVDYGIYSYNGHGLFRVTFANNRFVNVNYHHAINQNGIPVGPSSVLTRIKIWDPGTINNATFRSTAVSVVGAVYEDMVSAGFATPHGGPPAGILIFGSVTAPDTVTVTVMNHSGLHWTPGSGTLRVTLTKYQNDRNFLQ